MSFTSQHGAGNDAKSPLVQLIRKAVTSALNGSGDSWKMVVMDRKSQELILSVMTKNDIINLMVQDIELIESPSRGTYPSVKCVYFLEPSRDNIERIIADFSPAGAPQQNGKLKGKTGKDQQQAQASSGQGKRYAKAALFWIDALPEALFDRLTKSPAINYLDQCVDLTINFWPPEGRVFTYRNWRALQTLFGPPETDAKTAIEKYEWELDYMSKTIMNVLVTISEDPHIRYYNPPGHAPLGAGLALGEHLCKRLAAKVTRDMDAYKQLNTSFKPEESSPPRDRGILFIVDRTVDPFAPFLHEFTYQAMCNDLLPIKDGRIFKYTFTNHSNVREEREAILSDEDEMWTLLRHLHMSEVAETLPRKAKEVMPENQRDGRPTIDDLRDQLANLPETQKMREQVSLHLTMAEQCMEVLNQRGLHKTAELEQCCATGMTAEGGNPKGLVEQMVPRLADSTVSTRDKVRIIALYILMRDGVPEEDKKRLFQHARLSMHEQDAVNNMVHLGINVSKEKHGKRRQLFKQDTSRYKPVVKNMLEEHFNGKLDEKAFPYFGTPPQGSATASLRRGASPAPSAASANSSLRSARPNWTKGRTLMTAAPKQRVIVWVAGGMTYSEIRSVYEIGAALNKDVFIGSTHQTIPEGFIHELSNLDRGGRMTEMAPPSARFEAPSRAVPIGPSRILGSASGGGGSSNGSSWQALQIPPPPPQQQIPPPAPAPQRQSNPYPQQPYQQQPYPQQPPHPQQPSMHHGYSAPGPDYGHSPYGQQPHSQMLNPHEGRPHIPSTQTSPVPINGGFRPGSAASSHSSLQPQRLSANTPVSMSGAAPAKAKDKKGFFKRF